MLVDPWVVSIHESAHVMIRAALGLRPTFATIEPRGNYVAFSGLAYWTAEILTDLSAGAAEGKWTDTRGVATP